MQAPLLLLLMTVMFLSFFSKRSCFCFSTLQQQSSGLDKQAVQRQLGYLPLNYVAVSARNPLGEPIAIQTYPLLWEQSGRGRTSRIRKRNSKIPSSSIQQHYQESSAPSPSPPPSKTTTTLPIPFPTLYWLTCPKLDHAISELERQGYVSRIQDEIEQDADWVQDLAQCHAEYARYRWQSLTLEDREFLSSSSTSSSSSSVENMRGMIENSGIAGTNITAPTTAVFAAASSTTATPTDDKASVAAVIPSIKCLHTHYAHYRSTLSLLSSLSPSSSSPAVSLSYTLNPVGLLVHRQLVKSYPNLIV
jgi:hypothetical protein